MSNKYEQLVEFIINDETDKARELFHKIVVEKSRDIYESLVSEEDLEEGVGNDESEVSGLVRDVQMDEEGMNEEEEDEFDSEEGEEDEFGGEEEGEFGHNEATEEERITDLEDALDQLKAEFDALMADEANEPEHHDGMNDPDFGDDAAPEEFYEAAEEDDEEDEDEEEEEDLEESIVREYVEKVGDTGQHSESGKNAGTGQRTPASGGKQTKSTVAGKNDMGGTAVTSKGGNQDQDGTRPASHPNPKGTLVSNPQNKPGANAGKTAFKTKEAGHGAEKKSGAEGKFVGNDGSRPINKVSPVRK
jgi:hypothetical protein